MHNRDKIQAIVKKIEQKSSIVISAYAMMLRGDVMNDNSVTMTRVGEFSLLTSLKA